MGDVRNHNFREELGRCLGEHARECLAQAWTERSGNGDPESVRRVITQITEALDWTVSGDRSEIILRALEIATSGNEDTS